MGSIRRATWVPKVQLKEGRPCLTHACAFPHGRLRLASFEVASCHAKP